jgi:hypothetical protein
MHNFQLTIPARVNTPVDISLSLVAANTAKLGEIWIRVAQVGRFAAESAYPDAYPTGLELDFLPSGSLFQLDIVARTHDQRTISVVWNGSGGAADQRVRVTGVVKTGPATEPVVTLDSVSRVALAFRSGRRQEHDRAAVSERPRLRGVYLVLRATGGAIAAVGFAIFWVSLLLDLVGAITNDTAILRIGAVALVMVVAGCLILIGLLASRGAKHKVTVEVTLGALCLPTAMLSYVVSRAGEQVRVFWLIMALVTFLVGAALIALSMRVDAAKPSRSRDRCG